MTYSLIVTNRDINTLEYRIKINTEEKRKEPSVQLISELKKLSAVQTLSQWMERNYALFY